MAGVVSTEEQRLRQQRRMQLEVERRASEPRNQFLTQVKEERMRLWKTDPSKSWREMGLPDLYTFEEEARETVKKRWVEQGIWNDTWGYAMIGQWKHEEPLELESETETDTEAEYSPSLFTFLSPLPKPRRPKSDEEKRQIAERRVIRERERAASRPYHQFFYQVSKQRDRIQEESNREGTGADDINTRAYEIVKNTWTKQGIWKPIWVILPGMSWKHEEPLEEEAPDGTIPISETTLRNTQPAVNHGAENGFFAPLFGPLTPVESNHREASAIMIMSQQRLPADIESAGLENSDAEHPPAAPNSPRPRTGKRVLGHTKGHMLRPSKRKQSQTSGQRQPGASASLGPVNPSKVSKAAGKTKPGRQRRMNISQEISTGDMPLSSSVDAAELQRSPPPYHVTRRRSKRIQPPMSNVAKDPAKTVSTHPSKRAI